MEFKYCKIIFMVAFCCSYYSYDQVNAGGPSVESCEYYKNSFTELFSKMNSSVYITHDTAINKLNLYAAANKSQSAKEFSSGINSIANNARTKISGAIYDLFDEIAEIIPSYTSDDIANFVFSDNVPKYPLSCITNLHDIFYTFVLVDGDIDDLVSTLLSS
ncbi:hypothetical protein PVAND_008454 [Polypedilum vanderplanki]|uniref:Uncharacterized protein n=1 Tax=Polypedilum vanderplanki TaxID=319348 RepID=A0A9J6C9K6_POLVA|nr:hypothetical protein PVAND_008454 [Polypedilum vanderplanki]